MKTSLVKIYLCSLTLSIFLFSCKTNSSRTDQYAYNLGVVGGFSELINAGVKHLALSPAMSKAEMDSFILDAKEVADKYGVAVYRELNLIVTDLFPADIAKDKEVLVLYKGTSLDEYLSLKADQERLKESGKLDDITSRMLARRYGRMLSYSPRKINKLLAENTTYRTMDDFGIIANNLFLYYKDLKAAGEFYTQILGMEIVADYEMALILRMTQDSYLILVDAANGMHTADEPKTVALALLTDQLEEWYTYLQNQKVQIKYSYKPKAGSAHDGFVIVDPEGYLLEIERFNQHPENEKFVPLLALNKENIIQNSDKSKAPKGLHFHSTITWLYYKDVLAMQNFYQDILGLEMVADQGWTKIYKVSESGFIAIVDERQGMHNFTENKAVNVGFIINQLSPWFEYVKEHKVIELRKSEFNIDSENRYKAFVAFDPESYYLEFDSFLPHDDNTLLMNYLNTTRN